MSDGGFDDFISEFEDFRDKLLFGANQLRGPMTTKHSTEDVPAADPVTSESSADDGFGELEPKDRDWQATLDEELKTALERFAADEGEKRTMRAKAIDLIGYLTKKRLDALRRM